MVEVPTGAVATVHKIQFPSATNFHTCYFMLLFAMSAITFKGAHTLLSTVYILDRC